MTSTHTLTTEQLAVYLGITTNQVRQWKQRQGWPADAFHINPANRRGYYDLEKVTTWLRSRDVRVGRPPTWLAIVGHPMAGEKRPGAGHG